MQPNSISPTTTETEEIPVYSAQTSIDNTSDAIDSYAPSVSAPIMLPIFMIPLLWSSTAQAADTSVSIISKSGTYVDGKFTGKIQSTMRIPNLSATLNMCTGKDLTSYKKFPGVREASYSNGVLRYVLLTSDIGFITVRDFGYSLSTAIDTSRENEGIIKATWTNSGTQPATDQSGTALTNFTQNDGGWIFKKKPGSEDLYEVTWYVTTTVDPNTLQSGSGMIPNSAIASQTLKNAEAVIRALASQSAQFQR